MRDIGISPEDAAPMQQSRCTAGFALEVIGRLIELRQRGAARVLDHLVDHLATAACRIEPGALDGALAELRRAHVSDLSLVNDYIPEAARRLGRGWEEDTLSFMDVTLGVSRLAELLQAIGAWHGDDVVVKGQPSVLLVLPPGEQHTLGAAVLACRMRQVGISVCLRIAPNLSDLAALVATRGFAGAMVSLGNEERAENCGVLVRALQTLGKGQLRVAVGGCVIEACPDLTATTGADIVTNDLCRALALFGVEIEQRT